MSEEMKTNKDLEQNNLENQVEQKKREKTVGQSRKGFPLTGKETAIVGGVFMAGALLGVLIMALVLGRQGKNAASDGKNSDTKTISGNYDVQDCVELGQYDGITVSIAVTQEDIEAEVESLLDENTTYEQKTGKVQEGDMVYADFAGYVDGKKIEETSDSDYIETDSEDWLEGFSEAFIGAETGKEFSFDIAVPQDTYGDDSVDGKTVTFKATVKYICGNEIVPEYNDDFVQSISESEYKTTDEYNAYLKQELAAEYEAEKSEYSWSEVVENSKVKAYPENMLKAAREKVLQEYYDMADLYGMGHDEIFQTFGMENEQDFVDNELEELAQDTVKEQLIVRAIAAKEKINYTEQEYEDIVEEEYAYNSEAYDSKEEYEKADRAYLEETALQTTVKSWIADRTNFTTEE
ncbi:MAG: hypothetical protein K2J67_06425 [Lachnospiraceae bacterium]|nr:hypothetical protein [Lachnospiraceae bacterium]